MLKKNDKFKNISLEIIEDKTNIDKIDLSIKNLKSLFD